MVERERGNEGSMYLMSRYSNVGFLRVVLHAGHCTDDLASVDFIIYVAEIAEMAL